MTGGDGTGAYPSQAPKLSTGNSNNSRHLHSECGQPWSEHPWPATHCPPARRVCKSAYHCPPVFTYNGTDRCDECWSDAQSDHESQR